MSKIEDRIAQLEKELAKKRAELNEERARLGAGDFYGLSREILLQSDTVEAIGHWANENIAQLSNAVVTGKKGRRNSAQPLEQVAEVAACAKEIVSICEKYASQNKIVEKSLKAAEAKEQEAKVQEKARVNQENLENEYVKQLTASIMDRGVLERLLALRSKYGRTYRELFYAAKECDWNPAKVGEYFRKGVKND